MTSAALARLVVAVVALLAACGPEAPPPPEVLAAECGSHPDWLECSHDPLCQPYCKPRPGGSPPSCACLVR